MNPGPDAPPHHTPLSDLTALLLSLRPTLQPGVYVFATLGAQSLPYGVEPLAQFREAEGLSVIVAEDAALHAGLTPLFRAAWITLAVHSDLHAVGLTAAVAGALSRAGISCNVVAAALHDHLFVPADDGIRAVEVLRALGSSPGDANWPASGTPTPDR